jgi:hypothetical protein
MIAASLPMECAFLSTVGTMFLAPHKWPIQSQSRSVYHHENIALVLYHSLPNDGLLLLNIKPDRWRCVRYWHPNPVQDSWHLRAPLLPHFWHEPHASYRSRDGEKPTRLGTVVEPLTIWNAPTKPFVTTGVRLQFSHGPQKVGSRRLRLQLRLVSIGPTHFLQVDSQYCTSSASLTATFVVTEATDRVSLGNAS